MELQEALARISEIRGHLARTEVFRGYRALPVALSGALALAAGAAQPLAVPTPAETPLAWLGLWLGTAVVSVLLCGAEMAWRYARNTSPLERERMRLAVGRFLPSLAAGGLVTLAFVLHAPEGLHLLPGLWAVFVSLGIFASLSFLPRPVLLVAAWYLVAGVAAFALAKGEHAFSPLAMGIVFGVGQLAGAAVLKVTLERRTDEHA